MATATEIFLVDTSGLQAVPARWWRLLPTTERKRVAALRQPQGRVNRGVAWGALIDLAAARLQLEPAQIGIVRDPQGKPHVQLPSGTGRLHVSLSHSEQRVAIALSGYPVGIDIERIRATDEQLLRRHYFPDDPQPQDSDPLHQLFELWTAKEALLKAVGTGLQLPLEQIVLHAPAPGFKRVRQAPPHSGLAECWVASLCLPPPYAGAIAVRDARHCPPALPQLTMLDGNGQQMGRPA